LYTAISNPFKATLSPLGQRQISPQFLKYAYFKLFKETLLERSLEGEH